MNTKQGKYRGNRILSFTRPYGKRAGRKKIYKIVKDPECIVNDHLSIAA
jgi:hypothetical protein